MLYHYCSMQTFQQILSNQSLRFTDVTKSNDGKEISWISKYVESILLEEISEIKGMANYKDLINDAVLHTWGSLVTTNIIEMKSPQFVCCFSEDGDMLSQWRGYSDDGKGVAIGFDDSFFQMHPFFECKKVVYREEEHIEAIRKIIHERRYLFFQQTSDRYNLENILEPLYWLGVFHKNPAFVEEKEFGNLSFGNYRGIDVRLSTATYRG